MLLKFTYCNKSVPLFLIQWMLKPILLKINDHISWKSIINSIFTFSIDLNPDRVKDEQVFKRKLLNDQNRTVTIGEWKMS